MPIPGALFIVLSRQKQYSSDGPRHHIHYAPPLISVKDGGPLSVYYGDWLVGGTVAVVENMIKILGNKDHIRLFRFLVNSHYADSHSLLSGHQELEAIYLFRAHEKGKRNMYSTFILWRLASRRLLKIWWRGSAPPPKTVSTNCDA